MPQVYATHAVAGREVLHPRTHAVLMPGCSYTSSRSQLAVHRQTCAMNTACHLLSKHLQANERNLAQCEQNLQNRTTELANKCEEAWQLESKLAAVTSQCDELRKQLRQLEEFRSHQQNKYGDLMNANSVLVRQLERIYDHLHKQCGWSKAVVDAMCDDASISHKRPRRDSGSSSGS